MFTSLTPTLFYFSVWELGIAGSELSLLSTLSPIILAIPGLFDIASSRNGRTVLHCLTLSGLLAYLLKSPLYRLLAVAFANAMLCIGLTTDWCAPTASMQYRAMRRYRLKYICQCLTRVCSHGSGPSGVFRREACQSLQQSRSVHQSFGHPLDVLIYVPVWPFLNEASGGWNKTGIALACLAIWNFYIRDRDPGSTQQVDKSSQTTPAKTTAAWYIDGFSLGSLIYTLHCFLTDSSTLITWSWTGYPVKGPLPHVHGSLTHIAQAFGLLLPLILKPDILAHPLWLLYGSVGAYVTYAYKDWPGYVGGLNYAVFLMSIIPVVLARAAANKHVARAYTMAFLVAALFDVASTFTVAYAFVPGGEYFRERTHM